MEDLIMVVVFVLLVLVMAYKPNDGSDTPVMDEVEDYRRLSDADLMFGGSKTNRRR